MATNQKNHARHQPVLFQESIDALAIKPDGIYVDGTFGRGGHSRGILQQLGANGRLFAFDRDPDAAAASLTIDDPRFEFHQTRFSEMANFLAERASGGVDGVLLDLGVSSPQLDDAHRGFSFKQDGPLDMRMDPNSGISASEWLQTVSQDELTRVIRDYGEERAAVQIAKAIIARRGDTDGAAFQTTRQLAALVANVVGRRQGRQGGRASLGKDPATRTFQAIRIFINQELEELKSGLTAALSLLKTGGRLAVISFHSLEDRIVKQFMVQRAGKTVVSSRVSGLSTFLLPSSEAALPVGEIAVLKKILPSSTESEFNPRARSAVLRVAQRTQV